MLVMQKYAVVRVGKQDDSTWVFASNIHLSSAGKQLSSVESRYIWIGHVFMGQGVACDTEQYTIELPLTSDPLCTMMTKVKQCYGHNFFPCVLTMASSIIALHYTTMLKIDTSQPCTRISTSEFTVYYNYQFAFLISRIECI